MGIEEWKTLATMSAVYPFEEHWDARLHVLDRLIWKPATTASPAAVPAAPGLC